MVRSGKQPSSVWARIPGVYDGIQLDRGQVIPKVKSAKSEQLQRLAYLIDLDPEDIADLHLCPECGAYFKEEQFRRGHFEKRHKERAFPLPVRMSDEPENAYAERVALWKEQQDEAELRRQDHEIAAMPPDLEKTLASMR